MEVAFAEPGDLRGSRAIPFFEDESDPAFVQSVPHGAADAILRARRMSRFSGRLGEVVEWAAPPELEGDRIVLFGLGDRAGLSSCRLESAIAAVIERLVSSGEVALIIDLTGLRGVDHARSALAVELAAYRFDKYRSAIEAHKQPSLKRVTIVLDDVAACEESWRRWSAVAEGVSAARDLVNEPPNVLTPIAFAERLEKLRDYGLEVEVHDEHSMRQLGMNAMLAVGQGSANAPRLVVLRWLGAAGAAPLLVVGKGLTFDAGGLSLKPPQHMEDMKNDMGGAAAIAGLMLALSRRNARANVTAVVALAENMPDGAAQRPSDIIVSMSGTTIEVKNTDAEGRLVLADALWFGQKCAPCAVVDVATLTGNVVATLGHARAGIMCTDDGFASAIEAAGVSSGELIWRLPMGPEYDYLIDSEVADIKNVGEGPMMGSSIAGAKFLQRFIRCHRWCHIDIAGVAFAPKPLRRPLTPSWATGFGVRLLDELIWSEFEEDDR